MNTIITSREDILRASVALAKREGLPAVSIRGVAKECGISVGSVYNYFPAKTDLIAAAIERLWADVFHQGDGCAPPESFVDCVRWMDEGIRQGVKAIPSFFALHAVGFAASEKQEGRERMEQCFAHMKIGLANALKADLKVHRDVFQGALSEGAFVDFVFSNLLALLLRQEPDCKVLLAVVSRIVYGEGERGG